MPMGFYFVDKYCRDFLRQIENKVSFYIEGIRLVKGLIPSGLMKELYIETKAYGVQANKNITFYIYTHIKSVYACV